MATSRLRKTFKYPAEDASTDDEDLDEEHQEALINSLETQDNRNTNLHRTLFLLIPLTAALFTLYEFLFSASTARQRMLDILALSVLLATAFILLYMPVEQSTEDSKKSASWYGSMRSSHQLSAAQGPVDRYFIAMVGALSGVMVLAACVSWRNGAQEQAWREALPALVFGLTLGVRQLLAPLDLEQLKQAQFNYKGA